MGVKMETKQIAKAIIRYNNQFFVVQSNSVLKKWKFFDVAFEDNQNDISELMNGIKKTFDISQNIGKLFCEINYFEMGKQNVVKAYFVNIFDPILAEKLEKYGKFLLISELKTIKFENIDQIIFQKIVSKN